MERQRSSIWTAAALCALLAVSCRRKQGAGDQPTGDTGKTGAPTFISIGTGSMTGVYYQVGGALMKLVNRGTAEHGLKASFQSTGGSVYNINAVLNGDLELGLAQSDRQYQAAHGQAEWEQAGPQQGLRAICSVHPESVTLVAAVDTGIVDVAGLGGKRVNIGNPGSGLRGNAIDVLRTVGLDWQKDLHAEGVKGSESSKLLQDGRIDAFFYTVGHPAGAITESTAGRRKVRIIPVVGMEALLAEFPYYARTSIPVKLYPQAENKADIPTIGVMTTLVTSAEVSEGIVYSVAKALFEGLDEFRTMHPAFACLDAKTMVASGLSAPVHPGALRYFREAGLAE